MSILAKEEASVNKGDVVTLLVASGVIHKLDKSQEILRRWKAEKGAFSFSVLLLTNFHEWTYSHYD